MSSNTSAVFAPKLKSPMSGCFSANKASLVLPGINPHCDDGVACSRSGWNVARSISLSVAPDTFPKNLVPRKPTGSAISERVRSTTRRVGSLGGKNDATTAATGSTIPRTCRCEEALGRAPGWTSASASALTPRTTALLRRIVSHAQALEREQSRSPSAAFALLSFLASVSYNRKRRPGDGAALSLQLASGML